MLLLADIRGAQHGQAFRVRSHDAVFDAVVNHFDEMTGTVWPTMQITLLGGTRGLVAPRSARYVADAGSEAGKDGIQVFDYPILATNHHAVTSLQSPDATAGSDVDVMDSLRRELLGATN